MIPFFGPFISWAPPVVVALVLQPESALPALILMGAGWFVVMNVLQPRIMQGAVGIHPIVVLGSVLIGGRIAGIPGRSSGSRSPPSCRRSCSSSCTGPRPIGRSPVGRRAGSRSVTGDRSASRASRRPAARPTSTSWSSTSPTWSSPTTQPKPPTPTSRGRPPPHSRERRRPKPAEARDRPAGHDPRAGQDRAARPRQGARRAAGRRRGAGRTRGPCASTPDRSASGRPGRKILVTNDDGIESRGLLALKQALEPMGEVTVVAPDTNQSAVGHHKTLMRPLRVRERTLADGSIGLVGRRLADRRGQPRLPRLLRPRLRPRRVGHQLRRQPRRRHHLLGHGQRGDGGGHQRLPGLRDLAGVLRASRFHAGRPGRDGRRPEHPRARPVARAS